MAIREQYRNAPGSDEKAIGNVPLNATLQRQDQVVDKFVFEDSKSG